MNEFHWHIQALNGLRDLKQRVVRIEKYEALRRGIIPIHHGSYSPQSVLPENAAPAQVWEALQIPAIDQRDLAYVAERAGSLPPGDRGRAEQVIDTQQFRSWMLSDKHWMFSDGEWVYDTQGIDIPWRTMKLLVHGDYDSNDNVSGLSALCTTLTGVLRRQTNFISLVFFCGRHLNEHQNPGPLAMIRSLVDQLLLRMNPFCPSGLLQDVSMPDVRRGDIGALCTLFGCLIRHLNSTEIVFCMIDGIGLYESDEYRDDMEKILNFILSLAEDDNQGVHASIKVFLTSTQPTQHVRNHFKTGTSLITIAAMPDVAREPSPVQFNT